MSEFLLNFEVDNQRELMSFTFVIVCRTDVSNLRNEVWNDGITAK